MEILQNMYVYIDTAELQKWTGFCVTEVGEYPS